MNRSSISNRCGFSRRELLLVIAVSGSLLAGLFASFEVRLREGQIAATVAQGKALYWEILGVRAAPGFNALSGGALEWPSAYSSTGSRKQFESSLKYFTFLFASNRVQPYGQLAHSIQRTDIGQVANTVEARDRSPQTPWCLTMDIDDRSKAGSPIFFTQNFRFRSTGPETCVNQMTGLEERALPFGDKAGVVVQFGGNVAVLRGTNATPARFNPTSISNGFLWPLASGQALR